MRYVRPKNGDLITSDGVAVNTELTLKDYTTPKEIDYTIDTTNVSTVAMCNVIKIGRLCIVSFILDLNNLPTNGNNYRLITLLGVKAFRQTQSVTYFNDQAVAALQIGAGSSDVILRPMYNSNYTTRGMRGQLIFVTQ